MQQPSLDSILAARALTKEQLSVVCSEEHCNALALKITTWEVLSPFIKLTEHDIWALKTDYRTHQERKIEMFRLWRQRLGDEATYLLLAEAFEILKWRNMIIQLLDLFCLKSETMRQLGRDHPPPVPRLGDKPKPHQILRVTGKSGKEIIIRDQLASKWEDLCLELQFEPPSIVDAMLRNIDRNCDRSVEEACREVLLKWLSGYPCSSGPVTWQTLIKIIKRLDYIALGDELENELLP